MYTVKVISNLTPCYAGSSGDVVVKVLACGAGGPGIDYRCRRYDFSD